MVPSHNQSTSDSKCSPSQATSSSSTQKGKGPAAALMGSAGPFATTQPHSTTAAALTGSAEPSHTTASSSTQKGKGPAAALTGSAEDSVNTAQPHSSSAAVLTASAGVMEYQTVDGVLMPVGDYCDHRYQVEPNPPGAGMNYYKQGGSNLCAYEDCVFEEERLILKCGDCGIQLCVDCHRSKVRHALGLKPKTQRGGSSKSASKLAHKKAWKEKNAWKREGKRQAWAEEQARKEAEEE